MHSYRRKRCTDKYFESNLFSKTSNTYHYFTRSLTSQHWYIKKKYNKDTKIKWNKKNDLTKEFLLSCWSKENDMSNSFKKIPEKTLRKKLLIIGALLDILKTEDKYVNKEKKSWLILEKILTYMISMILIYINHLTSDITNVLSRLHANFLILNLEKTKIMLVGNHQRTTQADDLVIEISN